MICGNLCYEYKLTHCVRHAPIHSHAFPALQNPISSSSFFFFSFKAKASGGLKPKKVVVEAMVLDSILSSPCLKSPSFKRQFTKDELGSWSTLVKRHRYLLTALVLLAVLCTVYLYFAVTLGANGSCSGMNGAQKASCHMELVKDSIAKGKLKIL